MARRLEELVRRVRAEMQGQPEAQVLAAISELHRREAAREVSRMQVVPVAPVSKDWHDALLETPQGKQMAQAKLEAELLTQARAKAYRDSLDRYRQLTQLVYDIFPVQEWKPAVRFDTVLKLSREGGDAYEKAVAAVKYAQASPAEYKEVIRSLGL